MPTCLLNTFRDSNSTSSVGNLFQWLTTLLLKKFFPPKLPLHNLRLFPLLLELVTWGKETDLPPAPFSWNAIQITHSFFIMLGKYLLLGTPYQKVRKNRFALTASLLEYYTSNFLLCEFLIRWAKQSHAE